MSNARESLHLRARRANHRAALLPGDLCSLTASKTRRSFSRIFPIQGWWSSRRDCCGFSLISVSSSQVWRASRCKQRRLLRQSRSLAWRRLQLQLRQRYRSTAECCTLRAHCSQSAIFQRRSKSQTTRWLDKPFKKRRRSERLRVTRMCFRFLNLKEKVCIQHSQSQLSRKVTGKPC